MAQPGVDLAAARAGRVLFGTCGWTDESILKCGRFYPASVKNAEQRLEVYSRHFPCVEVDSSLYAIPRPSATSSWASRVPPGFKFHFKAFGLFCNGSCPFSALPYEAKQLLQQQAELQHVREAEATGAAQQDAHPPPLPALQQQQQQPGASQQKAGAQDAIEGGKHTPGPGAPGGRPAAPDDSDQGDGGSAPVTAAAANGAATAEAAAVAAPGQQRGAGGPAARAAGDVGRWGGGGLSPTHANSGKGGPQVTLEAIGRDVEAEIWAVFHRSLEPVQKPGKMGCVVFQFQLGFKPGPASRAHVEHCRRQLSRSLPMAVEFRNRAWFADAAEAASTTAWLASLQSAGGVSLVAADELRHETYGIRSGAAAAAGAARPEVLPIALQVSDPRYLYIRLHRREGTTERLLSTDECRAWAARLEAMCPRLEGPAYFLIGTDFEDVPVLNARQLAAALPQRLQYDWKAVLAARPGSLQALFARGSGGGVKAAAAGGSAAAPAREPAAAAAAPGGGAYGKAAGGSVVQGSVAAGGVGVWRQAAAEERAEATAVATEQEELPGPAPTPDPAPGRMPVAADGRPFTAQHSEPAGASGREPSAPAEVEAAVAAQPQPRVVVAAAEPVLGASRGGAGRGRSGGAKRARTLHDFFSPPPQQKRGPG